MQIRYLVIAHDWDEVYARNVYACSKYEKAVSSDPTLTKQGTFKLIYNN